MLAKRAAVSAVILLAGVATAAAVPATVTTDLNVRSGPGTNYPVIGTLQGGTTVDVNGCRGSWCRVAGGWASGNYLDGTGGRVAVAPRADYAYSPGYDDYGYADRSYYRGFAPGAVLGFGLGWGLGRDHGWHGHRGRHHWRHR